MTFLTNLADSRVMPDRLIRFGMVALECSVMGHPVGTESVGLARSYPAPERCGTPLLQTGTLDRSVLGFPSGFVSRKLHRYNDLSVGTGVALSPPVGAGLVIRTGGAAS